MKTSRNDLIGWGLVVVGLIALILLVPGLASAKGPAPMRVLLGWGAFIAVPAVILGGVLLAFAGRLGWEVRWRAVFFGELLFLALVGLLHLSLTQPIDAGWSGMGGGIVGQGMTQPLVDLLGMFGARLVLLVAVAAAIWALWIALPPRWTGRVQQDVTSLGSGAWASGRRGTGLLATWMGVAQARLEARPRGRSLIPDLGWVVALAAWPAELWDSVRSRQVRHAPPPEFEPDLAPPMSRAVATPDAAPRLPAPVPVAAGKAVKGSRTPKSQEQSAMRRAGGVASSARPDWLPPMALLKLGPSNGTVNTDARQRSQLIKQTLAEFGIPVEVVSVKEGPTVTQFGVEPGELVREMRNGEVLRRRVTVSSILRLSNDLALALAAPSLRIEAPVPGRPYVGIEVPNPAKTTVNLRNILEAKDFAKVGSPLAVALGRDVSGDPVVADLKRMPHLLIAGATGSGKSVCVNAVICSLLMNNGPESVQLMMVDPKMVELPGYNGIPHLVGPVITDPTHAAGALAWLMLQMDERYRSFADSGVRNIVEYNAKMARSRGALPYIVLVIDELADLMMTAADDIERQVCRLAQMSRATGIHLVLATQRPSVDVITGLIKANFPARIAFAVTSLIDSRVILDGPGAEKLLGRGDMLFMAPDSPKLARIQGCYVSDKEIDAVVGFWKSGRGGRGAANMNAPAPWEGLIGGSAGDEQDELLEQALRLLETKQTVSTSLLQRQLRIGYPRAARLMEQLEEMGYVAGDEGGGRSRGVLMRSESQELD
jgi:S-DNA-T family DNA segregation ATPase FtsK/SpoIIIE